MFSSETPYPNQPIFGSEHPWKILYKNCSFRPDSIRNMAATINSCFFIEDLPRMFATKYRLIWVSGFRGEHFLEIDQSEIRIACDGHVC
jgi:hypothetical protein